MSKKQPTYDYAEDFSDLTYKEIEKWCYPRKTKISEETKQKFREQSKKNYGTKRAPNFITKEEMDLPENAAIKEKMQEAYRKRNITNRRRNAVRKQFKETMLEFLESNYDDLEAFLNWDFGGGKKSIKPAEVKKWFDERDRQITVQDAAVLSVLKNAIYRGDMRAFEILRDTVGERPKTEVAMDANVQTESAYTDLAKALYGGAPVVVQPLEADKKQESGENNE